jgi:hypothetical protein
VVHAIQDGFSKTEARLDPDLEAVRSDARLQSAWEQQTTKGTS